MHDAPDAEPKEMDSFPSHRHLKNAVKFVQRHGLRNRNAPPDHRADSQQPDLQLQSRSCFRRCPGIRHATRLQESLHNSSSLAPKILVLPLMDSRRRISFSRTISACVSGSPFPPPPGHGLPDDCQDEGAKLVSLAAEHRRKEVDDRGAFAPHNPRVCRLHRSGGQRECGARVAAPGQEVVKEVGEILHALFLHRVHVHQHGPERGAAGGPSTARRGYRRSPLYPQSLFRLVRLCPVVTRDMSDEPLEDGPDGVTGRFIAHASGQVGGQ